MSAKRYFSDPRTKDVEGRTGIVPRLEKAIAWWRWEFQKSPAVVAVHILDAGTTCPREIDGVRVLLTNNTERNVFFLLDETEFADSEVQ